MRKIKYKKKFCKEIIEYCSTGMSIDAFAGKISVTRKQLMAWAKENEEFRNAIQVAKLKSLGFWEKELLDKDSEVKHTVIQFVLSKRFSELYNDDIDMEEVDEPIKMEFEIIDKGNQGAVAKATS